MKNKVVVLIVGGISAFVIFTIVILVAFAMLFNYSMKRNAEFSKKRSAEAVGTITWVSQSHTGTYEELESKYSYTYVVNGKSYDKEETSPGRPSDKDRKGLKVKVCYDPSDPNNSTIYFDGKAVCGQ